MQAASPADRPPPLRLQGIGVSPGVVIGPAYAMAPESTFVKNHPIAAGEVDHEIARLEAALIETRRQLQQIQNELASHQIGGDTSILDAHLMVLDDKAFIDEIVSGVRKQLRTVDALVSEVAERYAQVFQSLDDPYLKERVVDIRDVARRIVRNLAGGANVSVADLARQHVVVAQDLAPSETALFRREKVIGFATDHGSVTSHTAVMARALGIPAVVGLGDITDHVRTGDEILVDGGKGLVIVHPSPEQLEDYGRRAEARRHLEADIRERLRAEPAVTPDGRRVALSANIEGPDELELLREFGGEGVGLFRTEYLFMDRETPLSEDEQADVYAQVAARVAPASVIIRTQDLGGDKIGRGQPAMAEANPFLGSRSIRLSLRDPEMFKTQLRAILRAGASGNVKLMYPMISGVGELRQANALLEEAKAELVARGVAFPAAIEVGVMIEIPSAALTADVLAREVQFFSLGTNDLTQYTLAVDRINERVAYLYQPTHPAVLRLIRETVEAGHRHGLWVGVCGEMAANPLLALLLLGLGVDELSVAPGAIPLVKDAIRQVDFTRARQLAAAAAACALPEEVLELCRRLAAEAAPELLELV